LRKRVATYGGRAFGARRASGERHHVGIDLFASRGDVVVAPEGGTVVATQTFNGPNAHAILLQTDSGPVILFGEVEPGSWGEFGLGKGSRVDAGQPVARVGINPRGSQMLHLEMYTAGTTSNRRWYTGRPPPSDLLDPSDYLILAAKGDVTTEPAEEHEHDDDDHEPEEDPPVPTIPPPGPDNGEMTETPGRWEDDPEGGHAWNWAALDRGWDDEQMRAYWGNDPAYDAPYSVERPDDAIPACRHAGGTFVEPNMCQFPTGELCRAYDVMQRECGPGVDSTADDDDELPDDDPTEADDIDPWDILPDVGTGTPAWGFPWWLGAIALLYLVSRD
jgi:hypothetical protein